MRTFNFLRPETARLGGSLDGVTGREVGRSGRRLLRRSWTRRLSLCRPGFEHQRCNRLPTPEARRPVAASIRQHLPSHPWLPANQIAVYATGRRRMMCGNFHD